MGCVIGISNTQTILVDGASHNVKDLSPQLRWDVVVISVSCISLDRERMVEPNSSMLVYLSKVNNSVLEIITSINSSVENQNKKKWLVAVLFVVILLIWSKKNEHCFLSFIEEALSYVSWMHAQIWIFILLSLMNMHELLSTRGLHYDRWQYLVYDRWKWTWIRVTLGWSI